MDKEEKRSRVLFFLYQLMLRDGFSEMEIAEILGKSQISEKGKRQNQTDSAV